MFAASFAGYAVDNLDTGAGVPRMQDGTHRTE
jgi:hypothetical protein